MDRIEIHRRETLAALRETERLVAALRELHGKTAAARADGRRLIAEARRLRPITARLTHSTDRSATHPAESRDAVASLKATDAA